VTLSVTCTLRNSAKRWPIPFLAFARAGLAAGGKSQLLMQSASRMHRDGLKFIVEHFMHHAFTPVTPFFDYICGGPRSPSTSATRLDPESCCLLGMVGNRRETLGTARNTWIFPLGEPVWVSVTAKHAKLRFGSGSRNELGTGASRRGIQVMLGIRTNSYAEMDW
jgi:hypothetical protein